MRDWETEEMTSFGNAKSGVGEAKCKDILHFFTLPMTGRSLRVLSCRCGAETRPIV